ncbi:MAG: ABC transporter [Ignavibacteria bacterium GWB2_35_12]|nr:MAG: ABC transporter [Ignavibacteria bacterium GWA2_35_8]OGU39051.1 MAG: ABC transporter [Ignavibacteria bacterium GWB2_35_12]OGU87898.1 MAG: ABC transporter [Ignavibacteria bacterium RIFOXYA2_FULL_35_10]OGV21760.1 MAG: ABC transporter [Ignavibacteria bacterium RIFOXYC2_FULL_35_21]
MDLINFQDVKKLYKMGEITVPALNGINFSITTRLFVSFIGPSGSGKTTLLNLIGCIDKSTEGKVFVAGTEINNMDRKSLAKFRGKNIGFIFQNFNLIPVLSVYENVEYPLIMVQNVPLEIRKQKINALLEKVGMLDQKDKYPAQLSGGQKQRVAIARALVTEPKLVLADEPTANLDHITAFKVLELMRNMKDEFSTTFIFATHDPKIMKEAEIIYTLEDGLIITVQENTNATLREYN